MNGGFARGVAFSRSRGRHGDRDRRGCVARNAGLASLIRDWSEAPSASNLKALIARLRWSAEWHVRDETYLSALARIVDTHTAHPLGKVWGSGDTASSDGQFFRAGGRGEARADLNARYGSEPGVLFYTHVSDRFTPFHTKVIAANAGEAAHVLDGLLDHESELAIREHATDTASAVDHVFGLCHLVPATRGLICPGTRSRSDLASATAHGAICRTGDQGFQGSLDGTRARFAVASSRRVGP